MGFDDTLSRKEFLKGALLSAAAAGTVSKGLAQGQTPAVAPEDVISADDLKVLERVFAIEFTEEERRAVLGSVRGMRRGWEAIRSQPIDYTVEPPTPFKPFGERSRSVKGVSAKVSRSSVRTVPSGDDLAFLPLRDLSELIRTRKITSVALTQFYLGRLRTYGDKLLNVVTLTPELALAQARQADTETAVGKHRGPLHGIPYGVKDLFATRGIKTTWGSEPHANQVFDYDAAVVERLREAGAVLVAKLSLGALAQGDVWFKGRTRNPWNPESGSSGSSAGSASAVAAGLVGFAIGTETLGSIVSPCHVCRVSGLRPTYGRVSRRGGMAVSWTMDKAGPICRTVEDSALVLAAICGADDGDPSSVDRPFVYNSQRTLKGLRVGYLLPANNQSDPDPSTLPYVKVLMDLGVTVAPIRFDPVPEGGNLVLGVEASAAFDGFTRSDAIDELKNSAWPNTYRSNRYVPAVEYLQAQRARTLLQRRFHEQFGTFDLFVANERGGHTLLITNLTGHPQVLVPNGVDERGNSLSVSFVGRLFEEDVLLAVAHRYQQATGHHLKHPDLSKVG